MHARAWWRLGRTLLLVGAIAIGLSGLLSTFAPPTTSVALAGVAMGNDNDEKKDRGNDDDEDHVAEGQVLSVDQSKDPPELTIANVDGPMLVKALKTDEIDRNGVTPGDHIRVLGEKIHEQLFEATQIEVTRKCCR